MRRAVRVLRSIAIGLVAVVLVVVVAVYALSELILRRTYAIAAHAIVAPRDSLSIAEGERLARLRGCTGCHGAQGEGEVLSDNWLLGRIVAPNLSQSVREFSDEQLEGLIRQGVRPNGRSLFVMPSGMLSALTDEDLGRIIAFMRSLPARSGNARDVRVGPLGRTGLLAHKFTTAVEDVRRAKSLASTHPSSGDPNWKGAYLARTVCTECHGFDLRGDPGGTAPDLRIAASYPLGAFAHLMRTGKAAGGRELTLMSSVARNRFSRFTDDEISALHQYLVARAQ